MLSRRAFVGAAVAAPAAWDALVEANPLGSYLQLHGWAEVKAVKVSDATIDAIWSVRSALAAEGIFLARGSNADPPIFRGKGKK